MTRAGAEVFHRPAQHAQALIPVSLVMVLSGAVALYLDLFLGLSVTSLRNAALVTGGGAITAVLGIGGVMRSHPVLIVDHEGLDWRLPRAEAGRIG